MKIVVLSPKSFYYFSQKSAEFEWYREQPAHYTTVDHIFILENSRNLIAVVYQSGRQENCPRFFYKPAVEEIPISLPPHGKPNTLIQANLVVNLLDKSIKLETEAGQI